MKKNLDKYTTEDLLKRAIYLIYLSLGHIPLTTKEERRELLDIMKCLNKNIVDIKELSKLNK